MKAELKSLFDKKGKIVNEMKDAYRLVSERKGENAGKATAEERAKFDSWDAELIDIQEQIDFHKRMEQLNLIEAASTGTIVESNANTKKQYNDNATNLERRNAISKALKSGYTSLSDEERTAYDTDLRDVNVFEKFLRGNALNADEIRIMDKYKEKRAQSTSGTAGGYTIPEGFAGRIVEYMVKVSDLLNWANILRTDTGNVIPFPINDDNSNTGELIGENQDLSSSVADLVFSVHNLSAYKMSSKLIKVSNELVQDNGVNLVDYIARRLAIRVGKIANYYYTVGTGSSQPKGFLQTRGKVTVSTSTFTLVELAELQDSIDPAYRTGDKVAFSMHSNLLAEIKGLALVSDKPGSVWAPSYRDGDPDRILGRPYFFNQAMSSTSATGDIIIAYGDWSKFNIRIVNDFTLRVLNERYAEYDQLALFGLMRTDSFLEDTTAVKYMDIS